MKRENRLWKTEEKGRERGGGRKGREHLTDLLSISRPNLLP